MTGRWLVAMSTVGVLVLLAVCGLGTYFIVKDEQSSGNEARKAGAPDRTSIREAHGDRAERFCCDDPG